MSVLTASMLIACALAGDTPAVTDTDTVQTDTDQSVTASQVDAVTEIVMGTCPDGLRALIEAKQDRSVAEVGPMLPPLLADSDSAGQ